MSLDLKSGEYAITAPTDEVSFRGIYLGEENGIAYFITNDGRYVLVDEKEVTSPKEGLIILAGKLDVRPNKHFISKKDKEVINRLEEMIRGHDDILVDSNKVSGIGYHLDHDYSSIPNNLK